MGGEVSRAPKELSYLRRLNEYHMAPSLQVTPDAMADRALSSEPATCENQRVGRRIGSDLIERFLTKGRLARIRRTILEREHDPVKRAAWDMRVRRIQASFRREP